LARITCKKANDMNMTNIVDWERGAPQWSAVLSAFHCSDSARGENSTLWPIYGPIVQAAAENRPYIVGQIGQSLDGRIATVTNQSHYINGGAARAHLHRLRALVDAVVVGVGTVIADDPQLTVRDTEGNHPARVIIDPQGRAPNDAKCFHDNGPRRIVIQSKPHVRPPGVECLQVKPDADGLVPQSIVVALAELGLSRILIEGGAFTLSRFLSEGCLDRLHILTGPIIIGSGKMGIQLPEISTLESAMRPRTNTFALPGEDILFDCEFDTLQST
jgi:diaminohydroxyphosphoribosylaminopyrimidine deaminase / 5-amino-6-(5-phosphoribosylamino)uracil reductase